MYRSISPLRFVRPRCGRLLGAAGVMICLVLFGVQKASAQLDEGPPVDSPTSDLDTKYPEYNDAVIRFRNGDFEGARQLLDQAKKNHPELPPSGVMLAGLFFRANQRALGRAALEGVVISEATDPEPFVLFGDLALSEGRVTDAELLYARAGRLSQDFTANPERQKILRTRSMIGSARVAEARGDWQRAEQLARGALKVDKDDVNAQSRLARALFKQGGEERDKEAYRLLTEMHGKNPGLTRPEISMALLYHEDNKRPDVQKQLFERAITRDPDGLDTRLKAAQWALESGDSPAAKSHAEKAVAIDSNSLGAYLLLGLIAQFQKDYPAAEAAFQQAHLLSPSNFSAMNNLALSMIEQLDDDKRQRAFEYAQVNARVFSDLNQPNAREAAVTAAWILFKLGREAEAELALQKLNRLWGAVTPQSAYFAAVIYQARGKQDVALQILTPALRPRAVFPERQQADELLARLNAAP